MDQSQDDKNRLKRSGKKRPQSQQQQEGSIGQGGSTSTANTNTTAITIGSANTGNTPSASVNSSQLAQTSSNNVTSNATGQLTQGISTSNAANLQSSSASQQLTGKNTDDTPLSQKVTVNQELLEYVNKLEYLVVSTRQKLLRERKAYQQIISSLALYFDAKGIRSQQVEQYVDSVVDSLKTNQEESELEFEQLDWVKFLHDKKQDKLKRSRDMIDLQGSNLHISTGTSVLNINSNLQNSSNLSNGLQNLSNLNTNNLQSSVQNSKNATNGVSSTFGSASNNSAQSNIIRLPMGNNANEEKKGSQQSTLTQSKLKSKGNSSNTIQQSQSQQLSKNYPASNLNNSGSTSGILEADSEEPKNKKKKKPNQSGGIASDLSSLQVNALNPQQLAYQQQQYELLMQQEQQKMLYQQFLHAQQVNQIQPKMNNQLFQQYLMNFQPQSNAQ
ncbi:hypothetical protein TTHERM_00522320 (macronuclear) [Tetrahymena thermophila SB210]|uniref:Uncharacterized protein n=1 Tax=Tetrahymena thermophila (strain SB210) TaxID=312017 RepID=I7M135_TETTS|nr:hypothetical protein TTHERM_00522320 [Tetrahymena thermophila SB210]EAR94165.3 hypothetical protein TTHERM_00522320 [Tetrahymena thermophila SB210]|eukprot:XP_001014410.3 hypothetical protein TTHERM_00522320 [Tetrahymena thermophila SB210]